jgi:signal transduction histidine kinase
MKFYCILKYSPKSEKYSVFYRKGGALNVGELVSCDKGLMPGAIDKTEILNSEDLKGHSLKVKKKKKNEELTKKEIELLVPLAVNGRVVGLMLLGRKRSDDVYNKSDVGLFGLVATQLASAIESSSLYEEINQLNKHLEVKVCEQTNKIVANAKELEIKNINLNKLLEVKNDFLRIVNHQLNTPVSIIKNSVYMIRSGSFTLEKGLSFIEDGTRQMEELFTNFWKAFSFEGEGMKINFQETNIEEIIGKLVENISNMPAVKSKNLAITIEKKGSLPKVKTDPKEITQVISNLLENAVTYTPAGGVNIYFEKKGKDYLKIFIKDSGNGIDKDEQKNLFEKFVRGARAIRSRPSGSGLGLYIAKKIVDASGGELKLEKSEVDKGSTFSITLPIWK